MSSILLSPSLSPVVSLSCVSSPNKLSLSLSFCVSLYLPPFLYLSVSPCLSLFFSPPLFLSVSLSVSPSIFPYCISECVSCLLPPSVSFCRFLRLPLFLLCQSLSLFPPFLSLCLSISVSLSLSLYLCLSLCLPLSVSLSFSLPPRY